MSERPKKVLWAVLRLLVAAGLIVYVVSQARLRDAVRPAPDAEPRPIVRQTDAGYVIRTEGGTEQLIPHEAFGQPGGPVHVEGIISIGRRLSRRWWWAVAALGAMMLQSPLGAVRWRLLLGVQGIHITFWESLRLTYIGWFFNNWLPGATGGDFVKAYYIATQTHHKPEAVTTVFLDRFLGLVSVCLIGAVAVTASLTDPRVRIAQIVMGTFMAAVLVGTTVFYSHRLRTLLRVDRLIARLPVAKTAAKVDRALFVYRYHKRKVATAVLYSWGGQPGRLAPLLSKHAGRLDRVGPGASAGRVRRGGVADAAPVRVGGAGRRRVAPAGRRGRHPRPGDDAGIPAGPDGGQPAWRGLVPGPGTWPGGRASRPPTCAGNSKRKTVTRSAPTPSPDRKSLP